MDWISGAIGLVGALIGGGATLLANRQTHKKQHADWLRREKIDAYTEILKFYRNQNEFPRKSTEGLSDIGFISARAILVAPPHVIELFHECQTNLMNAIFKAKKPIFGGNNPEFSQEVLMVKFFRSLEALEKSMSDDLNKG